jgi:hypothetical protein
MRRCWPGKCDGYIELQIEHFASPFDFVEPFYAPWPPIAHCLLSPTHTHRWHFYLRLLRDNLRSRFICMLHLLRSAFSLHNVKRTLAKSTSSRTGICMGLADVNSRRDKNVPKEKARSTNRSIFSLAVNSINSLSQRHSDALPESAPSVSA